MSNKYCPNCDDDLANDPGNTCVLAALIDVLRDRDEHTEEQLQALHAACDVDRLWDRLGPVIDDLGEGEFNQETT